VAHQTFFKHDMPSRFDQKHDRAVAKEDNWRKVSKQVDRRDNYRCRACHSTCQPDALDPLGKGHRHHLTFRSKGGQDVASNLVLLCARCHDGVHTKRTVRFEWGQYGADGPLEVWRLSKDDGWYLASREKSVGQIERD
jgi:Pyruvate/2-oxoacid:ferredoxin oxidoreductase delta subunit